MTPFDHEVAVRYSDLDTYGHVNNAVYATYCEEARVAYVAEVLGIESVDDFPAVVASLSLDFRAPVTAATTVDVRVRTTALGESSFTMAYELDHDDELVAEAESTSVAVDRETGESRPLPHEWRERIAAYEGLD